MKKIFSALLLFALVCTSMQAQVTERIRPAEWDLLIPGGKYMDRFLPMQGSVQRPGQVWGADSVQQRYVDNGIEDNLRSYWGGNILRGNDGRYHLFVCGWLEDSPKGHMYWSKSTVFHTVSDRPEGPYRLVQSIGHGHNPEAYQLPDGRVVVYVIDGFYLGASLDATEWDYRKFSFDDRGWGTIEGLSNLSFTRRSDGSMLMVCRGGGIWVSRDGLAPYRQITSGCSVYPPVKGEYEDPVIWRDSLQYHLIVNDWLGRIAYYERSLDGLHWVVEPGEAYVPGVSYHADGEVEWWFKYERPKVLLDEHGRVQQMNFAVIDTLKWEDLPRDRHSSKNICIPMRREMLTQMVTLNAKEATIRILAEPGFSPARDLDPKSLRWGSYIDVNYGGGATVRSSKADGDDLIVTFNLKKLKLDANDFAPKLMGRKTDGDWVFAYTRRPESNLTPAIISAACPQVKDGQLTVEVENFGLTDSQPAMLTIRRGNQLAAQIAVPSLSPYQSIILSAPYGGPSEGKWSVEL